MDHQKRSIVFETPIILNFLCFFLLYTLFVSHLVVPLPTPDFLPVTIQQQT